MILRYLLITLSFLIVTQSHAQFYNGSNLTFGKNRIQHKEFIWQYYRFDKFDTYFYEGGKDLAAYVAEVAPGHLRDIENKLDHVLQQNVEFIVYNTQSDFKQSNLGMLTGAGDVEVGGTAQIVGTKVFLFFEGDHAALERQIREGVCRLVIQDMLYGGDWKDVVKNSALLNLPEWYMEGLVSYLVDDWSPELRDHVRDGILSGRYKKFNRLSREEALNAGYSVWRYISDVYGASVIPNVLYMTMVSRNVESGFIFVLGVSLDQLMEEHQFYFQNYFAQQDIGREPLDLDELYIKTKKQRAYSQFKLSPDGTQAALVSNELGQYRILLFDVEEHRTEEAIRKKAYEEKKRAFELAEKSKVAKDPDYRPKSYRPYKPKFVRAKRIFKAEHKLDRLIDHSYPVLEWSPAGEELAFFTEKKGALWLNIYSLEQGKNFPREVYGLEKVLSFDYAAGGRQLVLSGVVEGRTDLYLYYLVGNRQERLTNDTYDDLDVRYVNNGKSIIFVSDRLNDTLEVSSSRKIRNENMDVFVMDLSDRKVLERITNTDSKDEREPYPYDGDRYTFLADQNSVYDRYVARYDSVISRIDTVVHYRYFTEVERLSHAVVNPMEYHVNMDNEQLSMLTYEQGRYRFNVDFDPLRTRLGAVNTPEVETVSDEEPRLLPEMDVVFREKSEAKEVDYKDFNLTTPTQKPEEPLDGPIIIEDLQEILAIQNGTNSEVEFTLPKARNYKLNFATDRLLSQFSNSFNNEFYQAAYGPDVLSPGISPALQWGMSDLFEDRRITASVLVAGSIRNLGYGVRYDNLTKRLDKSLVFVRQTNNLFEPDFNIQIRTNQHTVRYKNSYPLSEVFSVRGDVSATHERLVFLGENDLSLNLRNVNSYIGGVKAELVFDNTLFKGLNLYNGSRFKVWGEYYREYLPDSKTFPDFMVFGADFRHYQKIHRDIIAAFRIAGNTSLGQQRLLNFLGGVDNWLIPSPDFDDSVDIDFDQNYRYQTMISPMRGFFRNARNGTSAAVASAELRVPLFRYLMNKPIQSEFIQHFQIVGFGDVGSAWTGAGPYADDNSFSTLEIDGNPVSAIIQNQEDPVIQGYGFGLRSKLLGYFVRADWAWGVIDGRVLPYEFYISLNLDF